MSDADNLRTIVDRQDKKIKALQQRCGELERANRTFGDQASEINEHDRVIEEIIKGQAERIAALEGALTGLLQITKESNGVVGYHLNGDVASWGEFEEVSNAEALLDRQALSPPKAEDQ